MIWMDKQQMEKMHQMENCQSEIEAETVNETDKCLGSSSGGLTGGITDCVQTTTSAGVPYQYYYWGNYGTGPNINWNTRNNSVPSGRYLGWFVPVSGSGHGWADIVRFNGWEWVTDGSQSKVDSDHSVMTHYSEINGPR